MKFLFILSLISIVTLKSFATGGVIGGGEVNFKSLLNCEARGIDPTFPAPTEVQVVKEVKYDGSFITDAPLRILTLGEPGVSRRFFVSLETQLTAASDGVTIQLPLFRYASGSENANIGHFLWNTKTQKGELKIYERPGLEVVLANCH